MPDYPACIATGIRAIVLWSGIQASCHEATTTCLVENILAGVTIPNRVQSRLSLFRIGIIRAKSTLSLSVDVAKSTQAFGRGG